MAWKPVGPRLALIFKGLRRAHEILVRVGVVVLDLP